MEEVTLVEVLAVS